MSAPQWRYFLITTWSALACAAFAWTGDFGTRSWFLLVVCGGIPPAMLMWLWNEDRPQLIGSLSRETSRRRVGP